MLRVIMDVYNDNEGYTSLRELRFILHFTFNAKKDAKSYTN